MVASGGGNVPAPRLTRAQAGKLKVAELRARLSEIGRSTEGLKQELVDRLISAQNEDFKAAASYDPGACAEDSCQSKEVQQVGTTTNEGTNEGSASIIERHENEKMAAGGAGTDAAEDDRQNAPSDSVQARCNDDGMEPAPSISTITKVRGDGHERTVQQRSAMEKFVAPTLKEYEEHRERLVSAGFTTVFSPCSVTKPMRRADVAVAGDDGSREVDLVGVNQAGETNTIGSFEPSPSDQLGEGERATDETTTEKGVKELPAPDAQSGRLLESTNVAPSRLPLPGSSASRKAAASRKVAEPSAAAKGSTKRSISASNDRAMAKVQRNSTSARSFR